MFKISQASNIHKLEKRKITESTAAAVTGNDMQ